MYSDKLRRIYVANNEIARTPLRYIIRCDQIPIKTRMLAQFKLGEMPAMFSPHRIARRCVLSSRGRSIIREFNLSRIMFREHALAGMLPGITKASW